MLKARLEQGQRDQGRLRFWLLVPCICGMILRLTIRQQPMRRQTATFLGIENQTQAAEDIAYYYNTQK
jgi:hypothetical protein